MWTALQQFFTTPAFSEQDEALAARWLKIALWVLSIALVGSLVSLFIQDLPGPIFSSLLVVDIVVLTSNLICWILLIRGKVRLSGFLMFVVLFLLTSYTSLAVFRTIHAPNTFAYFVLIPLASLLLGKRAMNLVAVYSLIIICMAFYFERTAANVTGSGLQGSWGELFIVLVAIIVMTLMLNAMLRRLEESAEAIQQTATTLATTNRELQISQAQLQQTQSLLESRVRQRTADLEQANVRLEKEAVERQRVVEALRTSEAHWRSLVENVPQVIATLSPTGVIQFSNRPVGTHQPATLVGEPATMLHSGAQAQQQLQQALTHVVQTGQALSYESEEATPEGVRWQINRLGAIQEDGAVTALIMIAADITEQRQAQKAMYQSQKMESLGLLAGGVAHDFNNLLAAMLIQLSAALAKLPSDHPVRSHLQKSVKATERAADLTRQMLNYAGRAPTEIKPVDLNDLLRDNIHLFSAAIPKNVKLIVSGDTLPLVEGDKSQLHQLLMNLILNGADAMGGQNGSVTVNTDFHELSAEEIEYWQWTGEALSPGRYVKVEVTDTGCGMDAQTLSRIFDPFFTTKVTGRGLGLASVLGIVRAHKAGLQVKSMVGIGTTFSLLFPILETWRQLSDPPSVETPLSLPTGLVLVIDDEEDVREATAAILCEAGLQVLTAVDGPPGIQIFRERMHEIKLVLLDLAMPEMNGADVLHELKSINPTVPVILVSGYDETSVKDRLVANGLATFIPKPYSTNTLLQRIQEQLQIAMHAT